LYIYALNKYLFDPLRISVKDPTKSLPWVARIPKFVLKYLRPFMPETLVTSVGSKIASRARNPCGFDTYFPRLFTVAHHLLPKESYSKSLASIVELYTKFVPRDIIALNTLTTLLMLHARLFRLKHTLIYEEVVNQ